MSSNPFQLQLEENKWQKFQADVLLNCNVELLLLDIYIYTYAAGAPLPKVKAKAKPKSQNKPVTPTEPTGAAELKASLCQLVAIYWVSFCSLLLSSFFCGILLTMYVI